MKIIAELCQNHNGNVDTMYKMIDAAVEGGATHIKTQTIFADNLTFRPRFEEGYISTQEMYMDTIKRPFQDEYNRLKELELPWEIQKKFVERCLELNITPLTTCFTHDSLENIKDCGFTEVKFASYDCGSHCLINRARNQFNHIYVSTGASFDDEIVKTCEILKGTKHTMLHCVTQYPLNPINANLNRIDYLKKGTKSVGYSDHSCKTESGLETNLVAIFKGIDALEFHFTILDQNETKDGKVSLKYEDIIEIKKFCELNDEDKEQYLNNTYPYWERCLGKENRSLSPEEIANRDYYRGRFSSRRAGYKNSETSNVMNWESW